MGGRFSPASPSSAFCVTMLSVLHASPNSSEDIRVVKCSGGRAAT